MQSIGSQQCLSRSLAIPSRVQFSRLKLHSNLHAAARPNRNRWGGKMTVAAEGNENGSEKDSKPSPKQEKLVQGTFTGPTG
jgi:hypothetical protein